MVIFRRPDGKPGCYQADSVDDALRLVEMLRNQEKVTDARIFRMEEVPIEIRTYYKVEVAGEQDTVQETQQQTQPLSPVPPVVANALPDAAPSDEPLDPMPVEVAAGRARRFGSRN